MVVQHREDLFSCCCGTASTLATVGVRCNHWTHFSDKENDAGDIRTVTKLENLGTG